MYEPRLRVEKISAGTFCGPRLQELLGEHFHVSKDDIRGFEQGTSILPARRVGEKERDYLERILRRSANNKL